MPADDMRGGRRGGGGGGGGESEEGAYVQDAEGRGSGECNCFDLKAYLACSITRCNFLSLSGGRWGPAVTELDSPPVALTLFFPAPRVGRLTQAAHSWRTWRSSWSGLLLGILPGLRRCQAFQSSPGPSFPKGSAAGLCSSLGAL